MFVKFILSLFGIHTSVDENGVANVDLSRMNQKWPNLTEELTGKMVQDYKSEGKEVHVYRDGRKVV